LNEPLCPSFNCVDGALLIGIIGHEGEVNYINPAPIVDIEFVNTANQAPRPPEQRFRFAAPCIKSSCAHWDGDRCGVVDLAIQSTQQANDDSIGSSKSLPKCSIRSKCRWFAQRGRDACSVCPAVFNYYPSQEAEESWMT
jgi:hypothetical protein